MKAGLRSEASLSSSVGRPGSAGRSRILGWLSDEAQGQHWRAYFFGLVAFYIALTVASQFRWFVSGAMYAEMATNYYPAAAGGDWRNLFATDAGYIPLPQRLIAAGISSLGAPVAAIPYLYQSLAYVLGGLSIAAFAHPIFRPLVRDDRVRALACFTFCFLIDFETRQFVNFTYIGIFLTLPLTALAMTPRGEDAPWWAWFMPILMLSKPIELAMIPAIALAAAMAKPRFRWVMLASLLVGIAQLVRLATSAATSTLSFVDNDATLLSKLSTAVLSGAGTMGGFSIGFGPMFALVNIHLKAWLVVLIGLAITGTYLVLLARRWRDPPALLLVGMMLVYAVALMNSVALSRHWNLELQMLRQVLIHRWTLGGIAGAIFCLFSAAQLLTDSPGWRSHRTKVIALLPLMILWLGVSLWPSAIVKAMPRPFPETGNSFWRDLSDRIDGNDPVCVPVDPYWAGGSFWMFRRNCVQLTNGPEPNAPARPLIGAEQVALPDAARGRSIVGIVMAVRPAADTPVHLKTTLLDQKRQLVIFEGRREVGPAGGLVLLSPIGGPATAASPLTFGSSSGVGVLRDPRGAPAFAILAQERP